MGYCGFSNLIFIWWRILSWSENPSVNLEGEFLNRGVGFFLAIGSLTRQPTPPACSGQAQWFLYNSRAADVGLGKLQAQQPMVATYAALNAHDPLITTIQSRNGQQLESPDFTHPHSSLDVVTLKSH